MSGGGAQRRNVLERFVMFAVSTEHDIDTVFQDHTTPKNVARKTKMSNAMLNSHIVSCFRFAITIPSRAKYTGHEMTKIYAQPTRSSFRPGSELTWYKYSQ